MDNAYPPPPIQPAPAARTNPLSIVSLVTGILGILTNCPASVFPFVMICGGVFSIAALVTGLIGMNQIKLNPGVEQGKGMSIAGIVMGIINLLLICLFVILALLIVFGALALPFTIPYISPDYYNY